MNNLLKDNWLTDLPDNAVRYAENTSQEVVEVIIKRINKIGQIKPSDAIKLTNALEFAGADYNKIVKAVAKGTKKTKKEIYNALSDVAQASDSYVEILYNARNIPPIATAGDKVLTEMLEAIYRQTTGIFSTFESYNLSNTLAFKINGQYLPLRQAYITAIDNAIYQAQTGTVDYYSAMRKTIRELSDGIKVVEWSSGYRRRLDSQVRQNLLDGCKQLSQQMLAYHGEQVGSDGVELSAHAISAPDHSPVQGRQFSQEQFELMQSGQGFTDLEGNYYDGFPRKISEWNCKHIAFPIIIGISERIYDEDQLKEFEQNSEKLYKKTQQMRAMETKLRKLKTDQVNYRTAGDELNAKETQLKIDALQQQYKNFANKNGIKYAPERARVDGYRKISTK